MKIAIELIVPVASLWARRQERRILREGVALSEGQLRTAARLGIAHPERVRLLAIRSVPPLNPLLRWIGKPFGLSAPHTIGMALQYGIYIRSDEWGNRRLLIHELAHVAQYERMGGFGPFLRQYLRECVHPGYPFGDLEQEARQAETSV